MGEDFPEMKKKPYILGLGKISPHGKYGKQKKNKKLYQFHILVKLQNIKDQEKKNSSTGKQGIRMTSEHSLAILEARR